jgi:Ca-activated chloride channel family protein
VRFATPIALLALLLVPLAVAGYLLLERRRREAAAAFATPARVPNLIGRRPGRLRHLPPALALLALALVATGLARPHATLSVPREEATVVLAVDVSRSMVATDVKPSRLASAQDAVRAFLAKLPDGYRVAIVSFAQGASVVLPPTADRELAERALVALRPGDGTALGGGIARAVQVAERVRGKDGDRVPAAVVLLSDGAQTIGTQTPLSAARRAGALDIPISTVALGTAQGVVEVRNADGFTEQVTVPPDPRTLRRVAAATKGRFYEAPDGERLRAVYEELGSRVGRVEEEREITAALAAAGGLLLLGAGLASAVLFGRIP